PMRASARLTMDTSSCTTRKPRLVVAVTKPSERERGMAMADMRFLLTGVRTMTASCCQHAVSSISASDKKTAAMQQGNTDCVSLLRTCSQASTLRACPLRVLPMIFRWFESLIDTFKDPVDGMPPQSVARFYLFYLRQVWPVFAAAIVVGFGVAVVEVSLFGFIGRIVDMARGTPADLFRKHGRTLVWMAVVALVARPVLGGLHDLLMNQTILPSLNNRIRWQNHRYVIRQSLAFFQNDYAGRIANRIMQTGGALRESAVQVVDALWYVIIYTGSAIALFAQADVRLALPLVAWVFAYVGLLAFFIPRVKQRSWKASEAKSKLMGRIVDGYSNVLTLKLFAHTRREARMREQLQREHVAVAVDDPPHQLRLRLRRLPRALLDARNEERKQTDVSEHPGHQRQGEPHIGLREQGDRAAGVDDHVPQRIHHLHRRFAQRAAGLHDAVGDAPGIIVLEEGEALADHIAMVLPADAIVQAGQDRLVHQQVVQAAQHGPRHQRDHRHPHQRAPMLAEKIRRRAARHVHDAANEAEQRHLHHRHAEADHDRRGEHRPHLAQVEQVETRHRLRRHAVDRILERVDDGFEPAKDHGEHTKRTGP